MSPRRARSRFASPAVLAAMCACHGAPPAPPAAPAAPHPAAAPVAPALPTVPTGTLEGNVFLDEVPPLATALPVPAAFASRPECVAAAARYRQRVDLTAPGPFPGALVFAEAHDARPIPSHTQRITIRACDVVPRLVYATITDRIEVHDESGSNPIVHFENTGATIDQVLLRGQADLSHTFARPGFYPVLVRTLPMFAGAGVYVFANRFIATSDPRGHFRIESLPAGSVVVHGFYPSFADATQTVTIRANEVATVDFHLRPAPEPAAPVAPPTPPAPTRDDAGIVFPM